MIDKDTLRKAYLRKRLLLSEAEFVRRNQLLQERFEKYIRQHKPNAVHAFLSIEKQAEVSTFPLISFMKKEGVERIAISKSLPLGELLHYWYDEKVVLKNNKWGIPEPEEGTVADIDDLDIVLVPLISFDKTGHRIGYGKGYYDRFLSKIPNVITVGLSLSPPLDSIPFTGELDVALNYCITPFATYQF
ncbi:5-formyltetrahydrofolate cyclo-ligase [Fulvivirga sediminis]|uniref:5-formyltetrahydrofolate cyclo-ligase n=1 Tax=Fulvivirga sediminis TaxID=2803949 RepID=A0A937FAS7_9BACT|nr:5-formyltetrahydrofolate cyclo-ligase [Fulvivirga sediminis]MBL3657063.1 5-formyltetrahydrofolate cyclo-ligase [Fulvivirga sediminis]